MSSKTIDLGEVGQEVAPAGRGPRSRWLLILLLAVPLAGDAPSLPAPLLWLPQVVDVALGNGSLYAVVGSDDGWVLTRYELPDGTVSWATPLGFHDGPVAVELAGTVPVVATARSGTDTTIGYDPETGSPRWQHAGWPGRAIGERIVLHRPGALVAVELTGGAVAWSIPVDGSELQMYGWSGRPSAYPTELVMLSRQRLTRYDLATGTARVSTALPGDQPYYPAVGGGLPSALLDQLRGSVFGRELTHPAVAGGLVMLSQSRAGAMVAAYDLLTLTPRWQLPGYTWAAPCGPVVCAVATDLSRLSGIDPATGTVRWTWQCRADGPGDCYVLPSALGPDDPMLVQQWLPQRGGVDTAWLVDPSTGAEVAELGQWRAVGRLDGDGWLLRWVNQDEPIYGRRVPPERTWLARLSVDPPQVTLLGSIESPALPELVWLHARAGGGGRA